MCGRYALYGPRKRSRAEAEYFESLDAFPDRRNVAPTDLMPVCRLIEGTPGLSAARWGLVPADARDLKGGARKINAPAQNILRWSEYRLPYKTKRRCLVPASGFYEWQKAGDAKIPYHVIPVDEPLFAFAGLWQEWHGGPEPVTTFTIVTVDANDVMTPLHERMPVIIRSDDYAQWLEDDDPRALLRSCHNEMTYAYRVSTRVNSVKNDDASLVEPIEDADRTYLAEL